MINATHSASSVFSALMAQNGQLGGALRARALAHWRASSGWSADSDGPRLWQGGEDMHKLSPLVCAGVFVRGLSLFLTRRR